MERKDKMKLHALDTALRIGSQYLNPKYDPSRDMASQEVNEVGVIGGVMAELTKQNQDVGIVWRIIKNARKKTTK